MKAMSIILLLLAIGCQATSNDSNADGPVNADGTLSAGVEADFYAFMSMMSPGYDPITAEEGERVSDVIAIGSVVDLREGRTLRSQLRTGPRDQPLMVVVVEARRVEKGEAFEGRVYFEIPYAPVVGLENLKANLPEGEVMVFLNPSPTPTDPPEGTEFLFPGRGYPDGVIERTIRTPEMWLIENEGRVVSPLVSDGRPPLYNARTLDEIADAIKDGTSQALHASNGDTPPAGGGSDVESPDAGGGP